MEDEREKTRLAIRCFCFCWTANKQRACKLRSLKFANSFQLQRCSFFLSSNFMSLSGDQPITGFFSPVNSTSRRSQNPRAVRYSSKRKRAQTDAHSSPSEANDLTPKPPTRKARVKESGNTLCDPDVNNESAFFQSKYLQVEKGEGTSGLVNLNGLQTPLTSAVHTTNKRTSALHERELPTASTSSAIEVPRRRIPHADQKALQTPPPTNPPDKRTFLASTSTPFTPLTLVTSRGLELSSSGSPVHRARARARLDKTAMLPPTPVTAQRGSILADTDIITSPLHVRRSQDNLVSLCDPFVSDASQLVVPSSQSLDLNREFDIPSSPCAPTISTTSSPTFKVPYLPGPNSSDEQSVVQSSQSQYLVPYDSSPTRRRPSSIHSSGDSTSSPIEEIVQSSQSQVENELSISKASSYLLGDVPNECVPTSLLFFLHCLTCN